MPSPLHGLLVAATLVLATPFAASAETTADVRRADLDYLVEQIRTVHPEPFSRVSEAAFEARVDTLARRLPSLGDAATLVEFQRLVALLRDGHTSVRFPSEGTPFGLQYPVVIYPFEDGTYVTGADRAYANLVGGRVTRIGELPLEEAMRRIRTVISGENAFTILDRIPNMLTVPPVLHALGISAHPDRVEIEVVAPDGSIERASVTPLAAERVTFVGPELVSPGAVHARKGAPPRHLRDPRAHYWFEHIPGDDLLYVQFNRVRNDPEEPLGAFFERVFAFADAHDVETFVLDIRYNHGGNNQLLHPLIHGLIRRHETINRPGHFFTIIGRGTFSAAVSCTAWLEEHTNVRFVGEPAGSAPNHFGDAEHITLPGSGVVVRISAWRWQTRLPWDDRQWFAPSLAVPSTYADYVAGRDGALERIREVGIAPTIGEMLVATVGESGAPAARAAYADYKARNPDRWGVTTEAEVNAAGYDLLTAGEVEGAITVFTLNAESYPESANVWDSLAEGHLEAGHRERAIELYHRAMEVDPTFENARRMLTELTGTPPAPAH